MNALEIFGICFIVEICAIVFTVIMSMIAAKLDLINKKRNYKKMMQMDENLRKNGGTASSDTKTPESDNKETESKKEEDPMSKFFEEVQKDPSILNEAMKDALSEGYKNLEKN